jgi:hypothetical protein
MSNCALCVACECCVCGSLWVCDKEIQKIKPTSSEIVSSFQDRQFPDLTTIGFIRLGGSKFKPKFGF